MEGSKLFTVLVVGDRPEQLMAKYNINLKVERYIKYRYLDAEKMKENSIKIMSEIINNPKKFNLTPFHVDYFKQQIKSVKEMSTFEYYSSVTNGLYYDEDGNAMSDKNPNGKWLSYKLGDNFSLPFITLDGNETHQTFVNNVQWDKIHMNNSELYEIVWDLVHGIRKPINENEEKIYNNMKDKDVYFKSFKNKDEYVAHNCSFWHYAYLDENGWVDMDDGHNSIDWIVNFYDKFITKLKPTDMITVFECARNNSTTEKDMI